MQWFTGVPSPVKHPEKVNMVIFRENTEDIYAGIDFEAGKEMALKTIEFIKTNFPKEFKKIRFGETPEVVGIGIKPVSKTGTQRLVRAAIEYAIAQKKKSVTFVHKGNIMKYTEGAFMQWGYQLARRIRRGTRGRRPVVQNSRRQTRCRPHVQGQHRGHHVATDSHAPE